MTWIWDVLVLAAFALSVVTAWKRGFFKTLMGFVSWIVAVVASVTLAAPVSALFPKFALDNTPLAVLGVGVAIFVIVSVAMHLFTALVGNLFRLPILRTADRLLGAALGAVNGAITAAALSLAVYGLCAVSFVEDVLTPAVYEQTVLVRPLVEAIISYLK